MCIITHHNVHCWTSVDRPLADTFCISVPLIKSSLYIMYDTGWDVSGGAWGGGAEEIPEGY